MCQATQGSEAVFVFVVRGVQCLLKRRGTTFMQEQCNGVNKQGERCNGKALPDSEFCIAHDPKKVIAIAEARRRGGQARGNRSRAKRELEGAAMTASELGGILALTIRHILAGEQTPGVGQAIAALSRASLEAGKSSDLEERMSQIERRLGRQSG